MNNAFERGRANIIARQELARKGNEWKERQLPLILKQLDVELRPKFESISYACSVHAEKLTIGRSEGHFAIVPRMHSYEPGDISFVVEAEDGSSVASYRTRDELMEWLGEFFEKEVARQRVPPVKAVSQSTSKESGMGIGGWIGLVVAVLIAAALFRNG